MYGKNAKYRNTTMNVCLFRVFAFTVPLTTGAFYMMSVCENARSTIEITANKTVVVRRFVDNDIRIIYFDFNTGI